MLQILFALLAGILTVASPCILPVLPIVLSGTFGKTGKSRPVFIVLGFVAAFTFTAAVLSWLARHIGLDPNIIRDIGIAALFLFGVMLLLPGFADFALKKFIPLASRAGASAGLGDKGKWSAFFLGLVLGVVWTPCAGPVLASILTLVALERNFLAALILVFAYALGAGLPMLLIAFGGQWAGEKAAAIAKYSALLQKIFGALIIALAVLMYFGLDTKIYALILSHYPMWNPKL